jgi:PmbA/TldA metallopeptidase domain 1
MSTDLHTLFDCDEAEVQAIVSKALTNADDGELFIERSESESLAFTDGKLKQANYSTGMGFGLRVVAGEAVGLKKMHCSARRMPLVRFPKAIPAQWPPRPPEPTGIFMQLKTRWGRRCLPPR